MSAPADSALHVALQGDPDGLSRNTFVQQRPGTVSHHQLRSAQESRSATRPQGEPAQRLGDEAGLSRPALDGHVDGLVELQIRIVLPGREFRAEQELLLSAGPGYNDHPAVALPVRQRPENNRPQRSQTDAAGDDDQVTAGGIVEPPTGAERSAHPHSRARLGCTQRRTDRPDSANGVGEGAVGRQTGDRDRDLPHPERIEHHELSRGGRRNTLCRRLQTEGDRIGGLHHS